MRGVLGVRYIKPTLFLSSPCYDFCFARNEDLNKKDRATEQKANYKFEGIDGEETATAESAAKPPDKDLNTGEQTQESEQDALEMNITTEKAPTKLEVR